MICTVVGARPNFMKMAPVIQQLSMRGHKQLFVHTGQHYDTKMSTVFFDELSMPKPDVYLGVGSGSHAEQTSRVMTAFEQICLDHVIDLVIVAGDVNSTLACALSAAKLNIPVAHVEAGLRSFDRTMPEEINRVLTDHLAEILFTTEPSGNENLRREGVDTTNVFFVGNSMIDSLVTHLERALAKRPWLNYGFEAGSYGIVTLHRPANVDDLRRVAEIAQALDEVGRSIPLLFPIHPRTFSTSRDIWDATNHIQTVEPLGYLEFLGLMAKARVVITDSGGIQEETTALGVPCVTIRDNTERPITLHAGTNRLVRGERQAIVDAALHPANTPPSQRPTLWDGHAADRIVDVIEQWLNIKTNN